MSWIIALGALLILFIFFQIFRIGRLVTVASKEKKDNSNKINAALLLLFMLGGLSAFFWFSYTHFDKYTLPVASKHGEQTDFLFWVTMAVTVVSFSIIFILLFVFAYKYQHKEGHRATFYPENHYLELTWTIVPAIVLAALIFMGLRAWNSITSPASDKAEVIELIGQQFAWSVRYSGVKDHTLGKYDYKLITPLNEFGLDLTDKNSFDDFKALELHIPKGREVLFKIRAKDVLHSVFLPMFRVKMDAVPGMETQFKMVATKTTQEMRDELSDQNFNYEMACAELCGRGHFSMRLPVVVDEPADYDKWKAKQEPWLKQMLESDSTYIKNVPENLRELAMIKSGYKSDGMDSTAVQAAATGPAGSH